MAITWVGVCESDCCGVECGCGVERRRSAGTVAQRADQKHDQHGALNIVAHLLMKMGNKHLSD